MDNGTPVTLAAWGNFYLVTGTAAAALTGLQFVVQSLLASSVYRPPDPDDPAGGIDAFGTPTVVHFTLALLLSTILCVPWGGYGGLRATLVVLGVGALGYAAIVFRRARRQRGYTPVAEDWIWHVVLPAVAYAAVLLAGLLLRRGPVPLFLVAAATVLLLCVGIHNAWDTVTYLTVNALRGRTAKGDAAPPDPGRSDPQPEAWQP